MQVNRSVRHQIRRGVVGIIFHTSRLVFSGIPLNDIHTIIVAQSLLLPLRVFQVAEVLLVHGMLVARFNDGRLLVAVVRVGLLLTFDDEVGVDGAGEVLDVRSVELGCLAEGLVGRCIRIHNRAPMILIHSIHGAILPQLVWIPRIHGLTSHHISRIQVGIPVNRSILATS